MSHNSENRSSLTIRSGLVRPGQGRRASSIIQRSVDMISRGENGTAVPWMLGPANRLATNSNTELKIRISDETSVKDSFSSAIRDLRSTYVKSRISLMFEDRVCDYVDLGGDFGQALGSIDVMPRIS